MGEGGWLVVFIAVERLIESIVAQRNTARLRAGGAIELGSAHFPFIFALHVIWLATLWFFGRHRNVDGILLAIFIMLQVARLWVIWSLGRRWTTRIIVVPGAPLVSRGPYRLMRHPNYAIVAAEIAVVPLALGLPVVAVVFSLINAALLFWRILIENAALKIYRSGRGGGSGTSARGAAEGMGGGV
jgi:methyltransferase